MKKRILFIIATIAVTLVVAINAAPVFAVGEMPVGDVYDDWWYQPEYLGQGQVKLCGNGRIANGVNVGDKWSFVVDGNRYYCTVTATPELEGYKEYVAELKFDDFTIADGTYTFNIEILTGRYTVTGEKATAYYMPVTLTVDDLDGASGSSGQADTSVKPAVTTAIPSGGTPPEGIFCNYSYYYPPKYENGYFNIAMGEVQFFEEAAANDIWTLYYNGTAYDATLLGVDFNGWQDDYGPGWDTHLSVPSLDFASFPEGDYEFYLLAKTGKYSGKYIKFSIASEKYGKPEGEDLTANLTSAKHEGGGIFNLVSVSHIGENVNVDDLWSVMIRGETFNATVLSVGSDEFSVKLRLWDCDIDAGSYLVYFSLMTGRHQGKYFRASVNLPALSLEAYNDPIDRTPPEGVERYEGGSGSATYSNGIFTVISSDAFFEGVAQGDAVSFRMNGRSFTGSVTTVAATSKTSKINLTDFDLSSFDYGKYDAFLTLSTGTNSGKYLSVSFQHNAPYKIGKYSFAVNGNLLSFGSEKYFTEYGFVSVEKNTPVTFTILSDGDYKGVVLNGSVTSISGDASGAYILNVNIGDFNVRPAAYQIRMDFSVNGKAFYSEFLTELGSQNKFWGVGRKLETTGVAAENEICKRFKMTLASLPAELDLNTAEVWVNGDEYAPEQITSDGNALIFVCPGIPLTAANKVTLAIQFGNEYYCETEFTPTVSAPSLVFAEYAENDGKGYFYTEFTNTTKITIGTMVSAKSGDISGDYKVVSVEGGNVILEGTPLTGGSFVEFTFEGFSVGCEVLREETATLTLVFNGRAFVSEYKKKTELSLAKLTESLENDGIIVGVYLDSAFTKPAKDMVINENTALFVKTIIPESFAITAVYCDDDRTTGIKVSLGCGTSNNLSEELFGAANADITGFGVLVAEAPEGEMKVGGSSRNIAVTPVFADGMYVFDVAIKVRDSEKNLCFRPYFTYTDKNGNKHTLYCNENKGQQEYYGALMLVPAEMK